MKEIIIPSICIFLILTNFLALPMTTEVPTTKSFKESNCVCDDDEKLTNANISITTEVKNLQNRLTGPLKIAIANAFAEKEHFLKIARYSSLRDIHKQYSTILTNTHFISFFDDFLLEISEILKNENKIALSGIQYEIEGAIQKLFTNFLPTSFLCLSLGKCQIAKEDYYTCMRQQSDNWQQYFGTSAKIYASTLSQTIYRFKRIESLLQDLNTQLADAQSTIITTKCLEQLSQFVKCHCPSTTEIPCRTSCYDSIDSCFGQSRREWEAKLFLMRNMTNRVNINFKDDFLKMRKIFITSLRNLTERKSALYATHIAKYCGTLTNLQVLSDKIELKSSAPARMNFRTEAAATDLDFSIKLWDDAQRSVCNDSLTPKTICWDSNQYKTNEEELPIVTKDVRPRPMKEWLEKKRMRESSGNGMGLLDDEDFEYDGSGSGMPPPIIQISRNNYDDGTNVDIPKYVDLSAILHQQPSVAINEIDVKISGIAKIQPPGMLFLLLLFIFSRYFFH